MPVDYVELAGGFKPARNGEIFWMNNNGISSFLFPRSFCWHQHVAQKTPSFLRSPSWGYWFPLWCELTVCYFFFLSVIPSLIVFFLITFTTNEILPSATLATEWLTGSTGMSTFRDSFAVVLKRLNWLGMTLLVRNSLVRNKMLRNAYHNCVLSLTTSPPPHPLP